MSYPHLFLHSVSAVYVRRDRITVHGKPREIVNLTIAGPRSRDQWVITLDPGPADPLGNIPIIEEAK